MAAASCFVPTPLKKSMDSSSLQDCRISSSSMAASPSQCGVFICKHTRMRRLRMSCSESFVSLNPKCEVISRPGHLVRENKIDSMAPSLSALELLKTSTGDRYTKERSSIVVIGLNVHTSPVEMREKLAIPVENWPQAIEELCALNHIEEAAVLSTCNRIEIYVVALSQRRGVKEVTEWMSKTSGVPLAELCEHQFNLYNKDAIGHLFRVSSGLDSLVLGEGQILAQVKQVVKAGQGVPGFGKKISGLFKHAITVGKRVRTETNIGAGAVSVSAAAVELGLQKLPECSYGAANVLVVGAGKMGKLMVKHLVAKGCKKMVVVNRTEDRVASMRDELKLKDDVEIIYKPLSELLASTAKSDVVFTSTASKTPLLFKHDVENLPPLGPEAGRTRLFIDISVPRNVGSCVSDLETARVYNVDDLKEVVAANEQDRHRKAIEAQDIIEEELKECEAWMDSMETVPTIKKLRAYAERIRASELEKCMSRMGDEISKKQSRAVYDLSMGIMNKLLHGPMEHLRCDGSENRNLTDILENAHALNRIFSLESETSVLEQQQIQAKMDSKTATIS